LVNQLIKELSEIERDINWHRFRSAYERLEKIPLDGLTKEALVKINLLKCRNLELYEPELRLQFANDGLKIGNELNDKKLLLEILIAIAQCKYELALFKESLDVLGEAMVLLKSFDHENERDLIKMKITILLYQGINLDRTGKIDLAYEILNESEDLAEKFLEKRLLIEIYIWEAINRGHAENYILGLEFGFKAKKIAKEIEHKACEIECIEIIGTYYQWTGKYSLAKQFFDEGIELAKEDNKKYSQFIYRLGLNHFFIGNLDKAIEMFSKSTDKVNPKSTSYIHRQNFFWGEGLFSWKKGDLDAAIDHMNRCLDVSKAVGDVYHTNLNSIFLASIYFDKGEINLALDLTLKALENLPSKSQNYSIGLAQQLLGKIYQIKGEFNLALDHAQKSFAIQQKMEVTHHLVETILLLISISIDKGEFDLANNYLEKLDKIVKKEGSKYIKQSYALGHALILKASTRPKNWFKAIELLEKIIADKITNHSFVVYAMINLCELLINEFSISGEMDVLLELEKYTESLEIIAKKQNSYNLRLEANNIRLLTLWLKTQFSIVNIDIQKTKDLLLEARNMADEEGLLRLAEKITQQQGELIVRMDRWDEFIRKYYEFIKSS